jgi:hypothetical protein
MIKGMIGCAPSRELLSQWNKREKDLVNRCAHSHNKATTEFAKSGSVDVYDWILESVISGDFNNDNKLDLAVANTFDNSVSILLNSCS